MSCQCEYCELAKTAAAAGEKRKPGPKGPRRPYAKMAEYGIRLGATWRQVRRVGIARLDRCGDDDARRVLLFAGGNGGDE